MRVSNLPFTDRWIVLVAILPLLASIAWTSLFKLLPMLSSPAAIQAQTLPIQAGDVVHKIEVITIRALPSPSMPSYVTLDDNGTYSVVNEYWSLVGDEGIVTKQFVRQVDSLGATTQEAFLDGAAQLRYNYTPSYGLPEAVKQATTDVLAIQPVKTSEREPKWTAAAIRDKERIGYELVGITTIAGIPAIILEKREPMLVPPGISGPDAGLPLGAEPKERITRWFIGQDPPGIELGFEDIVVDQVGNEHIIYASKTLKWELLDQDAVSTVLDWRPPAAACVIDLLKSPDGGGCQ